jgi:hypothetical protein
VFFAVGQRAGMDDEDFIVFCDSEDDLQPSTASAAPDGAKLSAVALAVVSAAHNLFAFEHGYAMLGGVVEIPLHPAEDVVSHQLELYTLNSMYDNPRIGKYFVHAEFLFIECDRFVLGQRGEFLDYVLEFAVGE